MVYTAARVIPAIHHTRPTFRPQSAAFALKAVKPLQDVGKEAKRDAGQHSRDMQARRRNTLISSRARMNHFTESKPKRQEPEKRSPRALVKAERRKLVNVIASVRAATSHHAVEAASSARSCRSSSVFSAIHAAPCSASAAIPTGIVDQSRIPARRLKESHDPRNIMSDESQRPRGPRKDVMNRDGESELQAASCESGFQGGS